MEIIEVESYSEEVRQALNDLLPQLSPFAPVLTEAALRQVITAEASHLLLAIEKGRCCGTLTLIIMVAPTGKRARVEDFVVSENVRGRGIGELLIAQALKLAAALGAHRIELTSHPSRQSANALYKKMGLRLRETNTYTYPLFT